MTSIRHLPPPVELPKVSARGLVERKTIVNRSALARVVCVVGLVGGVLLTGPSATAGFPGTNGKIAFVSERDGNLEIYSMNSDGSAQTNLTKNAARDFQPAWAPDGSKVAFTSDRSGGNWDIWVVNADGTGVIRLTTDPALDYNPAWSADGTKIAWNSGRNSTQIWTMNADGTNQVQLTHDTVTDRHPKWSPDGTKIAFESYRGNWEIFVVNADGTGETRLTNDTAYDFEPDWAPDGSRIAWRTGRFDGVGDIAVMNPDGTGIVNLTNDPAYDREPGWSPDGAKIVYASVQGGDFDIRVMNADGSGQANLTTSAANDYDPDWAPGGSTPTTFTLTVTRKGAGSGTVASRPAGITCGTDCTEPYASGTVVTLRAKPATGSVFAGWSGACTGTGDCLVTMTAAKTATARFSPA